MLLLCYLPETSVDEPSMVPEERERTIEGEGTAVIPEAPAAIPGGWCYLNTAFSNLDK